MFSMIQKGKSQFKGIQARKILILAHGIKAP